MDTAAQLAIPIRKHLRRNFYKFGIEDYREEWIYRVHCSNEGEQMFLEWADIWLQPHPEITK